jgi:hypothetical protein
VLPNGGTPFFLDPNPYIGATATGAAVVFQTFDIGPKATPSERLQKIAYRQVTLTLVIVSHLPSDARRFSV